MSDKDPKGRTDISGTAEPIVGAAQQTRGGRLTRGSITGHLVGQTLPMIIGVAALMSVGLVDAYFIGQLGKAELAAVAFVFPVTTAISSLGVGVMVGINSVVARAIGEGDNDGANRKANFGIAFAVAFGLVAMVLLELLINPLFRLLQASPALLPLIATYMRVYALGLPLMMLLMGINGVMRGQGEARRVSLIIVAMALVNLVLDPILITGRFGVPALGIAGAAWASVISAAIACVIGFTLLRLTDIPFNPSQVIRCKINQTLPPILKVAGPAALSNAINPIGMSVLVALMASQGQESVAAFGAGGRIQSFALVPLLGLSGAIGAIVGQNWGAQLYDRSRLAMREAGWFCVVYGVFMALVLSLGADAAGRLFSDDPKVAAQIALYLRISSWGYAGFGLLITANGSLNAVGDASIALSQSAARVFFVMLPVALLARPLWGATGIFAAELAANVIGGLVAVFVVVRALGRSDRQRSQPA